jgi:hypothetical protein
MSKNGRPGAWSEWSECKNNKTTRIREYIPAEEGGKDTDFKLSETDYCESNFFWEETPPKEFKVSEWTPWGECKDNKVKRTRQCIEGDCPNIDFIQEEYCEDATPGPWSQWGDCIDGSAKRSRDCIFPLNGGKPCTFNLEEVKKCLVEVKEGPWSEWSKECHKGKSSRFRNCANCLLPEYEYQDCVDKSEEIPRWQKILLLLIFIGICVGLYFTGLIQL